MTNNIIVFICHIVPVQGIRSPSSATVLASAGVSLLFLYHIRLFLYLSRWLLQVNKSPASQVRWVLVYNNHELFRYGTLNNM